MPDTLPRWEGRNLRLIGHTDLAGHGDAMQIMKHGSTLYVGHMAGVGTSVVDISDPRQPRVVRQLPIPPGMHSHKVQLVGDVLLVNYERMTPEPVERAGILILDVSKPQEPREIGFFRTGAEDSKRVTAPDEDFPTILASRRNGDARPGRDAGVHRLWFADGRYAHCASWLPGYTDGIYQVVDVSDPANPHEVGRWWAPGTWAAGGEQIDVPGRRYRLHHPIVAGDRAYLGYIEYGMVILDVSQLSSPRFVSRLTWDPDPTKHAHTMLPLPNRQLVVSTDEALRDRMADGPKEARVIDVSDERHPRVLSKLPTPEGDFPTRGGRFGTHNLHENRPGTWIDDQRVFVTYFNAGLRVYDISDPSAPCEVASFLPEPPAGQEAIQLNDLLVDADGTIYVTDRAGAGLYILEPTW